MDRTLQISLAKRLLAHAEAGTTEMAPAQMRIPVTEYLERSRWEGEIETLHKRLPIVACLSSELPEPGSFLAFSLMRVPLLLTRDDRGRVNAYLNVCRHRGARVVQDGAGKAKRFACSYHGWTYNNGGQLLGVSYSDAFGEVDCQANGLTRLQADERAGMVFVVLTPGVNVDIDEFLAGVDGVIADHAENFCFVGSREVQGSNWKLVMEGHLESYHFASLHRTSIASSMLTNCATVDRFGSHLLITFCSKNILSLRDIPEADWEPLRDDLINPQFILLPSTTVTLSDGGFLAQIIRPGDTPAVSTNRLAFAEERSANGGQEKLDFVSALVREEDYKASQEIFDGMKSGAQTHVVFGQNEPGPIWFHEALRAQMAKAISSHVAQGRNIG